MSLAYKTELLRQLEDLRCRIADTQHLRGICDANWAALIEHEIRNADLSRGVFATSTAPLFFLLNDFFCPVDLVRWIDSALIALLDACLWSLPLERKVREARSLRSKEEVMNVLFELLLLGRFANVGRLIDIETQVAAKPGESTVDGLIRLGHRDVLLEATRATRRFLPTGPGVFWFPSDVLVESIARKIGKKVGGGKQLALAGDRPAILAVALNQFGADRRVAGWAIDESFQRRDTGVLSAIVVFDTWRCILSTVHTNPNAAVPLVETERAALQDTLSFPMQ